MILDPLHGDGYQWWSGLGSDIFILTGIGIALRHFNCHVNKPRFCWRWGHPVPGTSFRACKKHHPSQYRQPHGQVTAQHISDAHDESCLPREPSYRRKA